MNEQYISSYKKLVVWQKAKSLIVLLYRILKKFPKEELYGLSSQMKRASISVASNIAEGNQRHGEKDRARFFNIAQGSLIELNCQLDIALELGFVEKNDYCNMDQMVNQTGYLLTRLIQSCEKK